MKIKLEKLKDPKLLLWGVFVLAAIAIFGWLFYLKFNYSPINMADNDLKQAYIKKPSVIKSAQNSTTVSSVTNTTTNSWPVLLTNEQAASLTVVVNKKHKLPSDYVPRLVPVGSTQIRQETANAINQLISEASKQGYSLKIVSGYRSYSQQQSVYNSYVASDGQTNADTYSARPGFSEHQTGLVADIGYSNSYCNLEVCFGETPAGRWVAANASNFGFIIRYPLGKDSITGYQYEPWHLRYLGVETAKAVVGSGKTLDEYFGVAAGGYQ